MMTWGSTAVPPGGSIAKVHPVDTEGCPDVRAEVAGREQDEGYPPERPSVMLQKEYSKLLAAARNFLELPVACQKMSETAGSLPENV